MSLEQGKKNRFALSTQHHRYGKNRILIFIFCFSPKLLGNTSEFPADYL